MLEIPRLMPKIILLKRKLQSRCAKGLTSYFCQRLFRIDDRSEKFSGRVLWGWRPVKCNVIRRANQKVYLLFLIVGAQQAAQRQSLGGPSACIHEHEVEHPG